MSWDPITSPVDHIELAGKRSPGLCEVIGAGSPRKWDERRGYALSGATVVFRGIGLARFTVRLRFYTPEDWAAWYAWKPLVDKPPLGKRPSALDIWHPLLEAQAIKKVVVEDVGQPDQTEDGEWTVEIKFIEFRRPQIALAKPEGSKATPADPVEREIERVDAENKTLAQQLAQ